MGVQASKIARGLGVRAAIASWRTVLKDGKVEGGGDASEVSKGTRVGEDGGNGDI
jgi:hypothetical protein